MSQKIRFIVNPFSGLGKHHTIEHLIKKELDPLVWKWEVVYTKYPGHATQLSREAVGHFDVVVAVGGDGTVNEVGSALVGSGVLMGIIPAGSGNGLARHLNIPLKAGRALQMFGQHQVKAIDTMRINDRFSFNVSGVGFDGHISHMFTGKRNRGPLGYVSIITKEFSKYKSKSYRIIIDGVVYERDAFLISFANSSQYGNNFHIAPGAKIDDGFIDVCIIREFPIVTAPALLVSMIDKTIDQSKFDEIYLGRHVVVESDETLMAHVDGEAIETHGKIEIAMVPLSLNVMVPTEEFLRIPFITQIQDKIPNLAASIGKRFMD